MSKLEGIEELYIKYARNQESAISVDSNESLNGNESLINRYALFSYRGYDEDNLIKNGNVASEDAINPKLNKIINSFSQTGDGNYGAVEYSWSDFLYCKYLDIIPNNHLITLRRFPGPIEDNIYNTQISDKPDLARLISWFGAKSDNKLETILSMNLGFNWRELESEVQVMNSQKWNSGLVGGVLGNKAQTGVNILQQSSNETAGSNFNKKTNGLGDNYDPREVFGYYHNRLYGPVNVIDKMMARDRGLNFEHSINLTFEYKMKGYGSISPKEALLDILSNILTVTYNNAPFWGGAVRYSSDNRTSHILGDQNKLIKGDYVGYFQSVGGDLGNMFQNVFSGNNGFDLAGGLSKVGNILTSNFFSKKINEGNVRTEFQSMKALLTGEATGEWHLTIGNPFRPIAMFGNLILENTDISFDETLGTEDFPIGIKAVLTLKPARPRDKTDIESAFNSGKGRLYLPPNHLNDFLNIKGVEKSTAYVDNGVNKNGISSNKKYNNVNNFEKPAKYIANGVNNFVKWTDDKIIAAKKWHSVNEHETPDTDKSPKKDQ